MPHLEIPKKNYKQKIFVACCIAFIHLLLLIANIDKNEIQVVGCKLGSNKRVSSTKMDGRPTINNEMPQPDKQIYLCKSRQKLNDNCVVERRGKGRSDILEGNKLCRSLFFLSLSEIFFILIKL